jgi:hypothetical protein
VGALRRQHCAVRKKDNMRQRCQRRRGSTGFSRRLQNFERVGVNIPLQISSSLPSIFYFNPHHFEITILKSQPLPLFFNLTVHSIFGSHPYSIPGRSRMRGAISPSHTKGKNIRHAQTWTVPRTRPGVPPGWTRTEFTRQANGGSAMAAPISVA